jgi:NRAMP (natural resistance-associated macrophage protein)-like metal ion transporter
MAKKSKNKLNEFWDMLGPGLTTGAADDDPSGIATYSQAGASFGFQFLWTALFTFPFMAIIQEMCARIGVVTGRGLASAIRQHYPKSIIYLISALLFLANTFNLGADLGMMAKAIQLLVPINFYFLVIAISLISLLLQIYSTYKSYAKVLKWLALILFSYVFSALMVKIDWPDALRHMIIPTFRMNKDGLVLLTAILGTTISPYLFFWQTSQEVEEQIGEGKTTIKARELITTPQDIRKMRWDVWGGMLLSNVVMFFIIVVCAATLFTHGITQITDASQAALALKPLAGNLTYLLFTLGIVGTGMLAVPVLAGSSSYAISESFGWREGLYRRFKQAHAFYAVIIISMIVGLIMNFLHLDIIKTLIYSAVLNAFIAPIILAAIVLLASDKKVMKQWTSSSWSTIFGWIITIVMALASIFTIWYLITG